MNVKNGMQLSYRKLFLDSNNVEYSVIKTMSTRCLCLQGDRTALARIKKAYKSAQFFYKAAPENIFEPISLNENASGNLVNALFTYQDAGFLKDFLGVVPPEWQYATGKKIGRILKDLHSVPLTKEQVLKAGKRHDSYMEKLASYVSELPHLKNDRVAMEAISTRYDYFSLLRPVMRYGSLKYQKIMTTHDGTILLLPSYSFGPGCMCEDFASLEFENAGLYPVLCAGVIDGYFSSKVPVKFWMHFALYSALYSLWKCALKAKESKEMHLKMQLNSDRIREDFDNFKKPIPTWYSNSELLIIKEKAIKLAL